MKQIAVIYPATLMILFPLDFIFLRTGRRLFGANARDLILDGPTPAILFCVVYVACTVSFVNGPTPTDWAANPFSTPLHQLLIWRTFISASATQMFNSDS
jgi:uncharacterized membrane protein